jgi:hypothetical protein
MKDHYPCDIFKVASQCGIRLLDPIYHRQHRKPRECFAKKTLKKIGQRHGEAHLAITLRLIVETKGNAAELYSETIQAISGLLVTNPHLVERGGKLFDELDEISLGETRRLARALTLGLPASHVMRVMLALRLHREPQGDMLALMKGQAG